ncbi:hypothetical protein [Pseudanabaena sp. UWO311]|uniref:hypothetical protein n=1 Tax=Pseudanabaena sp. UWO311 TaxID=2487337 RepID=UPI0030DD4805
MTPFQRFVKLVIIANLLLFPQTSRRAFLQRFLKFVILANTLLNLFSSIGLKLDLVPSFKEVPLVPSSQTCPKQL